MLVQRWSVSSLLLLTSDGRLEYVKPPAFSTYVSPHFLQLLIVMLWIRINKFLQSRSCPCSWYLAFPAYLRTDLDKCHTKISLRPLTPPLPLDRNFRPTPILAIWQLHVVPDSCNTDEGTYLNYCVYGTTSIWDGGNVAPYFRSFDPWRE